MLSQIDKDLVIQCDAIAAQGGPLKLNEKELQSTHNNQQLAQPKCFSEKFSDNQSNNDFSQNKEVCVQLAKPNNNGNIGGMHTTDFLVHLF